MWRQLAPSPQIHLLKQPGRSALASDRPSTCCRQRRDGTEGETRHSPEQGEVCELVLRLCSSIDPRVTIARGCLRSLRHKELRSVQHRRCQSKAGLRQNMAHNGRSRTRSLLSTCI